VFAKSPTFNANPAIDGIMLRISVSSFCFFAASAAEFAAAIAARRVASIVAAARAAAAAIAARRAASTASQVCSEAALVMPAVIRVAVETVLKFVKQVSDAEAKARGPNVVSEAGIVSEVIGDESNASLPMLMTELPNVSDVRDAPQKAQSPMAVTKFGIVSEVSGTE
jgi:hypothetical protein